MVSNLGGGFWNLEDAGEPEHGVDVALVREREQEHVAPTSAVAGGRVALRRHGWRWWWHRGFAECRAWGVGVQLLFYSISKEKAH